MIRALFIFVMGLNLIQSDALPCTVFFLAGSPHATVAKNLDWSSGRGLIFINKRNVRKQGALVGTQTPLTWQSKYMNLTLTQDGRDFPWEGLNEAGLSVNVLELDGSEVPPASDPRPAVEMSQWIQYQLDTSATLSEAIDHALEVRVAPSTFIHYFICDSGSHCAVFEYLGGRLIVHVSGADLPYAALANDAYAASVSYLKHLLETKTPREIVSGKSDFSVERFSRAAIWSVGYSAGQDETAYAFRGLANVAESNTFWRMAFNLQAHVATLSTRAAPDLKSIDLMRFDPSCKTPVQIIDLNASLKGDASGSFHDFTEAENQALLNASARLTPELRKTMGAYPATHTKCLE